MATKALPTRSTLDPRVENDWSDLRPFNRLQVEALQPIWTWGQLGGSIRAARFGVEVEEAAVEEQAATVALRTGELLLRAPPGPRP